MQAIFHKYHALGNDYLVIDPAEFALTPTPAAVRLLCDRHFGVGSDGILLGPLSPETVPHAAPWAQGDSAARARPDCGVRIFNPDGSEAEKSGNGLRIFARYLWERAAGRTQRFVVATLGGVVTCDIRGAHGHSVQVEMGRVSFASADIPVTGDAREVLDEPITVGGVALRFAAATVGNPHCVVVRDRVSAEETQRLGPALETDARFPNRSNVQFMQILDRHHVRIEIWERGAGYTLASGSSASACVAVACRLGHCDREVTVHMPGGDLDIRIDDAWRVTLTGPVAAVAHGALAPDLLARLAEHAS